MSWSVGKTRFPERGTSYLCRNSGKMNFFGLTKAKIMKRVFLSKDQFLPLMKTNSNSILFPGKCSLEEMESRSWRA